MCTNQTRLTTATNGTLNSAVHQTENVKTAMPTQVALPEEKSVVQCRRK